MVKELIKRERIAEVETIKKELKLRWNALYGTWQVYTTLLGTGTFRWINIDIETKDWYMNTFNPPIILMENLDG